MKLRLNLFGLGLILITGLAQGAQQSMPPSGSEWQISKTRIDANFSELYANKPGDCTGFPCLDGTSDGGSYIKLYGPGGFWTSLQAGASVANRSYRLPIDALPSAGETNVMTMDEYGQMALLDKPSSSGYVLSSTDAGVLSWAAPATGSGDDLGSAAYSDVVGLWTTCSGYLKSDGTCDTPSGSFSWPTSDGAYYAAKDGAWASLATVYQPLDSDLTTWAGVTSTANGRSLVSAANYAAMRTLLDLEAGTDFNAYDADLATLAAPTNWRVFYSNGSGVVTQLALGADGTYLKSNGASAAPTWATPSGTMVYPGAGIPNSTGSAWGTSYSLDTDLSTTSASDDTIPSAKATKALVDGLPTLAAGTGITITEDGGGAGIDTINVTASTYQGLDADLTDLADGSLTGSKVAGYAATTASKSANYTIGTDNASEAYGGTIYVTSAATITAPAVAAGMNFTVVTIGAIAVSLDVNAADRMYLDGTALADGDKATNTSTTGDTITCQYESSAGWFCWSGSPDGDHWTDGN